MHPLKRAGFGLLMLLLPAGPAASDPGRLTLLLKSDGPAAIIDYLGPGPKKEAVGQTGKPFELDIKGLQSSESLQFVVRPENFGQNTQPFMPATFSFSLRPDMRANELKRWRDQGIHLEDARVLVVLRVEPRGAEVFSPVAGGYKYLGKTYEPLPLDRSAYLNEEYKLTPVNLAIGQGIKKGEDTVDVGPYYGWGPDKLWEITPWEVAPTKVSETDQRVAVLYPEKEPYHLKPAPGGTLARAQLWVKQHMVTAFVLAFGTAIFLILIPTAILPRMRARREVFARVKKFDEMTKGVDITRDPLLLQLFGTWKIWKKLGAGGMAVVYWALPEDCADDEEAVALKVMNDEVAGDPEYQKRFRREVDISKQLDHPNIVHLIDWGEREGRLYLVMEFIKGTTLRDHLPPGGLTVPETMGIMRGLSSGLAHAHKLGVVHRDLKPDNVMINHNKQVKIMDLGLAKRDENKTAITKTGDTFGTPAYMAPEQIAGSTHPDPRTDQYAVGVMLFELLTGKRPFDEEDSLQMIMKHLQAEPPSIREYKPELPEAAAQVVFKMLAKDPSQRYPNMQAACAALEDALRSFLTAQP